MLRSSRCFDQSCSVDVVHLTCLICQCRSSLLERAGSSREFCSWEGVEERIVKIGQLRTSKGLHIRAQLIESPAEDRTKLAERRGSSTGHGGERGLVEEASTIVSCNECISVRARYKR
jgi:hypothetical protein